MSTIATPPNGAPRILIDPGSHHLLNAGDVAMLQVCVERLRETWPGARIDVLTTAPELLVELCPGVTPLPAAGRYELTDGGGPALPRPRWLARAALTRAGRRRERREPAARMFADALLAADLFLLSGRGGLTDAFPGETDAVLTELEIAARIGLQTALLGQGIGPIEDHRALARMAAALPEAAVLSVREGRTAPDLLASLGVPRERVAVTGDDAIELAFRNRPERLGEALGLNVRIADYAGMTPEMASRVGTTAGAKAGEFDAEVIGIEISSHPHEDEVGSIQHRNASAPVARPAVAIAAAGRCRMLVAGSYHAAVFALAQGVPVVGIAASPYYVDKLLGLRAQFGEGCRIVRLDEGMNAAELASVESELYRQWEAAPALREELLAAAERQIELSRAAHARATAVIARNAV